MSCLVTAQPRTTPHPGYPDNRSLTPVTLRPVQAFLNTIDREHGVECLATPERLRQFLTDFDLAGPRIDLGARELEAALATSTTPRWDGRATGVGRREQATALEIRAGTRWRCPCSWCTGRERSCSRRQLARSARTRSSRVPMMATSARSRPGAAPRRA